MSMFMILHSKAYSIAVVKRRRIVIIFWNLEKYSLKQSFNFKKRVGESHVLLHNMLVESFKGKHKAAFRLG